MWKFFSSACENWEQKNILQDLYYRIGSNKCVLVLSVTLFMHWNTLSHYQILEMTYSSFPMLVLNPNIIASMAPCVQLFFLQSPKERPMAPVRK